MAIEKKPMNATLPAISENGIFCPQCGGAMSVGRTTPRPQFILRRRECVVCEHRETTVERILTGAPPIATAIRDSLTEDVISQLQESIAILMKASGLATPPPHNATIATSGDKP